MCATEAILEKGPCVDSFKGHVGLQLKWAMARDDRATRCLLCGDRSLKVAQADETPWTGDVRKDVKSDGCVCVPLWGLRHVANYFARQGTQQLATPQNRWD